MEESLQMRVHGSGGHRPALIYLPGIHGDWTLIPSFRAALGEKVRFVEITYPRTESWSLDDYANAVLDALRENKIPAGWLLGESFGSQIVWAMLDRLESGRTRDTGREDSARCAGANRADGSSFRAEGIFIVGGFVQYPFPFMAKLGRLILSKAPLLLIWLFARLYVLYAPVRHRKAPETLACLHEFLARRTPVDRAAMIHRLNLILANDPREIAARTNSPVFHLAGGIDPIVPMLSVRRWMRRNCPAFRDSRVIWLGDHNVLGTAPAESARQVLDWMLPAGVENPGGRSA